MDASPRRKTKVTTPPAAPAKDDALQQAHTQEQVWSRVKRTPPPALLLPQRPLVSQLGRLRSVGSLPTASGGAGWPICLTGAFSLRGPRSQMQRRRRGGQSAASSGRPFSEGMEPTSWLVG